jgi:chromosomal replication initiation ATPase DnaA
MKTTLPEIIQQVPLNILQAEIARRDSWTTEPALYEKFILLCDLVAAHYQIDPFAMRSKSRAEIYTWPRYVMMKIMRDLGWTLQSIADAFGYSDHGTIAHGLRSFAVRSRTDHSMTAFADSMVEKFRLDPDSDPLISKLSQHLQLS